MIRRARNVVLPIALAASIALAPTQESTPEARAAAALQAGNHTLAITLYREIVAAEPENIPAIFGLGQALYFAGEFDEGIPLLEAARDASGGEGIVLYVLGQAYMEVERFADAEVALNGAAAARPDVVPLAFLRAELCYRIGRGQATARRLDVVVRMAPEWNVPHVRLGSLRLDERRYADAVPALERALQLRPDDVDAALLLAVAYSRVELPEKALAVLEAVTSAVPDSVTALLALAERYDRLDRADQLVAVAERILALVPGHPVAEFRIAERANLAGDLAVALPHAQRAAATLRAVSRPVPAVRPGDRWDVTSELVPESRRLVADLQQRLGQTEASRAGAEALVAEFPLYPDGHFLLGNTLLRAQNSAGREHLEQFKRLTDARLHIDLGTNSLIGNAIEPAAVEFAAALELVPGHPVALVGLAQASRRAGDAGAAVALLERARSAGADPTEWYANYILALGALDRHDDARAAWAEAVQLGLELDYEVLAYLHADVDACRE